MTRRNVEVNQGGSLQQQCTAVCNPDCTVTWETRQGKVDITCLSFTHSAISAVCTVTWERRQGKVDITCYLSLFHSQCISAVCTVTWERRQGKVDITCYLSLFHSQCHQCCLHRHLGKAARKGRYYLLPVSLSLTVPLVLSATPTVPLPGRGGKERQIFSVTCISFKHSALPYFTGLQGASYYKAHPRHKKKI